MSATATIIRMPGLMPVPRSVPKRDLAQTEVKLVTPEKMAEWQLPPFQRGFKPTDDVHKAAGDMQLEAAHDPEEAFCTIPGIITVGVFKGDKYLLDGQHRRGAFIIAAGEVIVHGGVSVKNALVEVRQKAFATMREMAEEYKELNSKLRVTTADDVLKAIAYDDPNMIRIAEACPWIGYDLTGKENRAKYLLSMSAAIRTWIGSNGVVPSNGPKASEIVEKMMSSEMASQIVDFFSACVEAGWLAPQAKRLWSTLNLGIVMWMWRRLVLGESVQRSHGGIKPMVMTREEFVVCMAYLVEEKYLHDLVGRSLQYRDRVPCYDRIKGLFTEALVQNGRTNPRFPMPQGWT